MENIYKLTKEEVKKLATCLSCRFFITWNASLGYSEWTPGEPPNFTCDMHHLPRFDEFEAEQFFRVLEHMPKDCEDFKPKESYLKEIKYGD